MGTIRSTYVRSELISFAFETTRFWLNIVYLSLFGCSFGTLQLFFIFEWFGFCNLYSTDTSMENKRSL